MKKMIFALLIALPLIYFVACNKSTTTPTTPACSNVSVYDDSAALRSFAADSIQVTKDTTGIFYQIIDTGTGSRPVPTSYLQVTYKATLLNHSIFDTATAAALQVPLYQLIAGWQIGLQKIKEGGHIKLLIPSALAYGCQGATNGNVVVIPANAPVYFDIYLLSIGG